MGFFKSLIGPAAGLAGTVFGGPAIGALAGGAASSLFGGNKNPSSRAMPYLNQIQDVGNQAYNPYIQQGQRQGNMLESQYGQMAQDPTAWLNALQRGYKPSEGYQYKKDIMGRELGNTAAAGGFSGTEEHQRGQGELVNALLSGDMNSWLQNILGIQGAGQQGAQHQYDTGYNAAQNWAGHQGSALGSKASYASGGQAYGNANQNMQNQDMMSLFSNAMQNPQFLQMLGMGG